MSFTYKITGNSHPKMMNLIRAHAQTRKIQGESDTTWSNIDRYRAVFISRKELTRDQLKEVVVEDCCDGIAPYDEWVAWSEKTLLEELEDVHQDDRLNITPGKQAKAVERWEDATEELRQAKRAVARLIKKQERASRRVLIMHGKVPTYLNESIHDVTYIRETIMYLKRRGG